MHQILPDITPGLCAQLNGKRGLAVPEQERCWPAWCVYCKTCLVPNPT